MGADIEQTQKVAKAVWIAFIVSVVIYVAVAKFVLKPSATELNQQIRIVIYLLSFAAAILSRVVRTKVASYSGKRSTEYSGDAKNYMLKVLIGHIISLAMCEFIGVLAFTLYFLYGSPVDLYALSGLSIACLIFNYPRLEMHRSPNVTIH